VSDPVSGPVQDAVEVLGVTKRYGPTVALDHLDLRVGDREFVALSGPSGSGKSTLLHLIAGLERADAGTISVGGHRLSRHDHELSGYRRNEVGLIFQLHDLITRLSARQNIEVAMFGTHHRAAQRRARALELLDLVGLASKADHRPPMMSGGERQRVAIARALANEPPLLLADEPTGSLDDDAADQVLDLLARLRGERQLTILAVSHDDRLNLRADRVVTLVRGRVTSPVEA